MQLADHHAPRTVQCGTEDVCVFYVRGRPAVLAEQLGRVIGWSGLRKGAERWGEIGFDKAFAHATPDDMGDLRAHTNGKLGRGKRTMVAFLPGVDVACAKAPNASAVEMCSAIRAAMLFSSPPPQQPAQAYSNVGDPDKDIPVYNHAGRARILANDLFTLMREGDHSRRTWKSWMTAGRDYGVLAGQPLREFNRDLRAGGRAVTPGSARRMVLYESGVEIVRTRADKTIREYLAIIILPRLRQASPATSVPAEVQPPIPGDTTVDRLDRILGTVEKMVGQLTATVALLDAIVKRVPRAPARPRKPTPAP